MSIEQEFLSKDIGHREQLDMFSSLRVVIQGKEGVETLEQSDNHVENSDSRQSSGEALRRMISHIHRTAGT